jgi:uncharacterized membrane protein
MLDFTRLSLFADIDPVTPWSLPTVGVRPLVLVAVLLTAITLWTYLGVPGMTWRRFCTVLTLRLLALLLTLAVVLRPSYAFHDDQQPPSTLIVAADASESMTIQDEYDNQSRWQLLLRTLRENEALLNRLRTEHNINVILHRFGSEVADFDPQGQADGKRTDFGDMLHTLYEKYRGEPLLRGLIVLSDGSDNGTQFPPLTLASQWRALPCRIDTVGFGNAATNEKQRDIAITALNPVPSPVPLKGELTINAMLDAHSFENAPVTFHVFIDDKEVPIDAILVNGQKVGDGKPRLGLTVGNDVKLKITAPSEPGEVRLTLKVDPLDGEITAANNEMSTYLTVTKEGVSVLLVDKARWEQKFIAMALAQDPRIRVFTVQLRRDENAPDANQAELFQFDKQHYDVIILGDVTAKQLTGGDPRILRTINNMVADKGSGFMMYGGLKNFGTGDWRGTPIDKLLPVGLDVDGQIEGSVKIEPTEAGLRHYIMNLADRLEDNKRIWAQLPDMPKGVTRLGQPRGLATVFARSQAGDPVLVGQAYGKGRVLAFAADTTQRWRRNPEGVAAHARFWKQIVLWLAHQEETSGNVWVKPDTRRLAAGGRLGFSAGMLGKGGNDLKDGRFDVKVIGPNNVETPVLTARDKGEDRGVFWKSDTPGEYRLVVRGTAKDADGQEINGETTARFLVYQDDAEMVRRAADHDFLKKLAAGGGGRFHKPGELARYLQELAAQPVSQGRQKAVSWPDWRRTSLSGFLPALLMLFVALLSVEWFLRRRWGLV